jgi:two-component system phosphate regulon sensor histidine kinase PhoR
MFKKYQWNLVLLVLGVSVLGFIIFDLIFYHTIKSYLYEQTLTEMRMKTQLAVKLLNQNNLPPLTMDNAELYDLTYQIRTIVNSRVTIMDSIGQVLSDSDVAPDRVHLMDNHLNRPEVKKALVEGWGQSYRKSDTVRRKIFYTAFPMKHRDKNIGILRLAYYDQNFEDSMGNIIPMIIGANLLVLVILFFASLYLGHVVTAPILQIVRTAKGISAGDLEKSFPLGRSDEIGKLSLILNQLTEQLKSQITQISNERSKLQDILQNMNMGIIVLDHQKNILHANPETLRILALGQVMVEQKNILEILRNETLLTAVTNILSDGTKESGEFEYDVSDKKIFLNYEITPFLISEEKLNGALIQLKDITELKKLEAIRRDFVANASHELKTPLTAIIGYTETLLEGTSIAPASRTMFLRKILEQAQRLDFLISDLLKLSEIEREQPPDLKSCNMVFIIRDVIKDFKEQAQQKNVELVVESPHDVKVLINEESMRSALNNLIDNAIKYTTENGKISVRVSESENNRVKVEVIDNGIGIDPKYHERIFQRFYRIDKARSRALGGTGLGLAIVRHIVERHGSKIHVNSELGKGSCFWFELEKA